MRDAQRTRMVKRAHGGGLNAHALTRTPTRTRPPAHAPVRAPVRITNPLTRSHKNASGWGLNAPKCLIWLGFRGDFV